MKWFSLFALGPLTVPALVRAQKPEVATASAAVSSWVTAQSPDCGDIIGRVVRRASDFDASPIRLMPLVNAWVAIADSISTGQARRRDERSAAISDTAGVFRLRLPPTRTTVLEVKAMGYEPALIAVDGARYRAAVVEVTLGSAGFHAPYRGVSVVASRGILACPP